MARESFAAADLVDRPLAEHFSPGERLVVRLGPEQVFEGALERAGRDLIELRDVREIGNPRPLTGSYTFYRNEIDRIERREAPERGAPAEEGDDATVKMDEREYRRLKEVSRAYVYVESYEEHGDELLGYESLGVVALGLGPDARLDGVGLLVIGAWDRVHVYDMLRLAGVRGALRAVLESRRVCKVLHRAGPAVDVLRRRYGTTVRNYFDTETADLIIRKRAAAEHEETRDLPRCLVEYFNFPPSTLREASGTSVEKWRRARPLSDRRRLYASQLAVYLIPLRDEMRRALFGGVTAASERVCDHVYDMSSYRFHLQLGQTGVVDDQLDRLVPELSFG